MTDQRITLGYLEASVDKRKTFLNKDTYVETVPFAAALEEDKPFVCGRKGAGKTAVRFRLLDQYRYRHVVELLEQDYADLHTMCVDELSSHSAMTAGQNENLEIIFYRVWIIVLHVCAVAACVNARAKRAQENETIEELRGIWRAVNPAGRDPVQFVRRRLRKLIEECAHKAAPLTTISDHLAASVREEKLARAIELSSIILGNGENSTIVVIDTQERYDVSSLRILPLRGMCRAVREFVERQYYSGLTIKCFLPTELSDRVFYDNRFKYDDLSTLLTWDYSDLIEFVSRRYSLFLRRYHGPLRSLGETLKSEIDRLTADGDRTNKSWRDRVWSLFAPRTIRNRRGVQEDGPTYFLRHTQRRPRECLSAINHIVRRGSSMDEFPVLAGRAIQAGIHDRENLNSIVNSSLSIFRFNSATAGLQEVVGKVLANARVVFPVNDLRNMTPRAIPFFPSMNRSDVHELMQEILVRSGLLGVVEQRTDSVAPRRNRYCVAEFEYGTPKNVSFNESCEFALHPILADWLGIHDSANEPAAVLPVLEHGDSGGFLQS